MKVAILIVDISLIGGVEIVTVNLINKLRREGNIVEVICCQNKNRYENKNLRIHNLDILTPQKITDTQIEEIKSILQYGGFDKLIIQLNSFVKACILANPKLINRLSEVIRVYIVIHNSPKSFITRYRLYKEAFPVYFLKKLYTLFKYKRESMNFVRKIKLMNVQYITISDGCRIELLKYYGIDSKVIYNTYEPFLCDIDIDKKNEIIWAGRLAKEKNIFFLLDVWKEISHRGWILRIIGSGPEGKNLYTYVNDMGIEDVVFDGQLIHSKVIERMKESKLLALTSFNEGFPTVVSEAMNACNAVVAIRYDGFSEELLNNETSIVTSNNIYDYKNALQKLMYDDELLVRMRRNAYYTCMAFYDQ